MQGALLEVTETATGRQLLRFDSAVHALKASEDADGARRSAALLFPEAAGAAPSPYDDLLVFIAAAQEECYSLFGELMAGAGGGASISDNEDGGGNGGMIGESVPVSEWSQDVDDEPQRKRGKRM